MAFFFMTFQGFIFHIFPLCEQILSLATSLSFLSPISSLLVLVEFIIFYLLAGHKTKQVLSGEWAYSTTILYTH